MKWFVNIFCLLAILPVLAFNSAEWAEKRTMMAFEAERLHQAFSNCVAHAVSPAEDVSIPLETFPDGTIKTSIHADKAMYFLKEKMVYAEGVTVTKLTRDGEVKSCVTAKCCVIDQMTKSGWAEGPAQVKTEKAVLKGEDVFFSSPEGYVKVYRHADIRAEGMSLGGVAP